MTSMQRHPLNWLKSAPVALALAVWAISPATTLVHASPPRGAFHPLEGKGPMTDSMEAELKRCFELAREADPKLVVDTVARIEATLEGAVVSAAIPTPNSPSFQACAEAAATHWSFPPPPRPAGDVPPPEARLYIQFPIRLPLE